jgi:hypothetical protein
MSAIKMGLVAVLAIGGSLLAGTSAKAQYYYPGYVPVQPVVVAAYPPPPPVVYTTPVVAGYYGPWVYRHPVVTAVGVVTRPVRYAAYVARPHVFIP